MPREPELDEKVAGAAYAAYVKACGGQRPGTPEGVGFPDWDRLPQPIRKAWAAASAAAIAGFADFFVDELAGEVKAFLRKELEA